MPGKPNHWPLVEIAYWKISRDTGLDLTDVDASGPNAPGEKNSTKPQDREWNKWRTRKIKNEVLREEGKLLDADDVARTWSVRAIALQQDIKSMGKRIAPTDHHLREEIEEYCTRLLRGWAAGVPGISEEQVRDLLEHMGLEEIEDGDTGHEHEATVTAGEGASEGSDGGEAGEPRRGGAADQ
ncbi:MAG: hypothetical protein AAF581_11165 [Planctomycetota bacterium]